MEDKVCDAEDEDVETEDPNDELVELVELEEVPVVEENDEDELEEENDEPLVTEEGLEVEVDVAVEDDLLWERKSPAAAATIMMTMTIPITTLLPIARTWDLEDCLNLGNFPSSGMVVI